MGLFDSTRMAALGKALDAYAMRQRVIAENIANITTPGYKAQRISFEEQLAKAGDSPEHIAAIEPHQYDAADDRAEGYNALASGFNDVDIDVEMMELAKNQIRFKFTSRLLGDSFKGIQKAIRGSL